jgi:hypothetical protein
MSVERWLQVHLVALCLLGSLFVALTSENLLVPAGVLFAGVTSVIFTDTLKWFQLHRLLGNVAAVGAVVYSLSDFLNSDSVGQLLAIASLLVYLQVILFYQEKNSRLYWQMILLSLLQVVVGAALHLGIKFGVLLLTYTIVAVSALVLFFIHRETEQHGAILDAGRTDGGDLSTSSVPQPVSRVWKRLLGEPVHVKVEGTREETNRSFLTLALVRQIATLTVGALLFATAFFYAAPRHSKAAWTGSRGFTRQQTGFSREMELQQMGNLLQSDITVMKVWIKDSEKRLVRGIDPLLAGEVLVDYRTDDENHSRWIATAKRNPYGSNAGERLPGAPANSATVHVNLDATPHPSLFTIEPAYALVNTPADVRVDRDSRLFYRSIEYEGFIPQAYEYTVATTAIRDGRQLAIVPDTRRLHTDEEISAMTEVEAMRAAGRRRFGFERHLTACRQWGAEEEQRFAGLKKVAEDVLASHNLDRTRDPILIARALVEHFQSPGRYTYTLDFNFPRDRTLDPIESFVTEHRRGHCEYFASALVLMLRSQGIPARMVVGYRGSEFNEVGGYYHIRQRNAHAWVEMHLAKEQIPQYETTAGRVGLAGAWMRLDPTPASEDQAGEMARDWVGTARDWIDYVDMVWSDYVVGLNQQRQHQTMYSGFSPEAETSEEDWINASSWQENLRTLAGWLGIHIGRKDKGWNVAFDWRAGLTAMALCVIGIVLSRLLRWAVKRIDWWSWMHRSAGRRSSVPFYARLEDLLARRGRSRRPAETAQEYVDSAVRELAIGQGDALRSTVSAFYRVRFGGATLDSAETSAIEQALAEVERNTAAESN